MDTKDINIDSAIEFIEEQKVPMLYKSIPESMLYITIFSAIVLLAWIKLDLPILVRIIAVAVLVINFFWRISVIKSGICVYLANSFAALSIFNIVIGAVAFYLNIKLGKGCLAFILTIVLVFAIIYLFITVRRNKQWLFGEKTRKAHMQHWDTNILTAITVAGSAVAYGIISHGDKWENQLLEIMLVLLVSVSLLSLLKVIVENIMSYCLIKKYDLEVNIDYVETI